jgi:hypothetical protein
MPVILIFDSQFTEPFRIIWSICALYAKV